MPGNKNGIAGARKGCVLFRSIGFGFCSAMLFLAAASGVSAQEPDGCGVHPLIGEKLTFQGRWMGIPVGSGSMEVKEVVTIEGRKAYHIHLHGRSNEAISAFYPIEDTVDSYLDVETLRPLVFEKHQREGRYRADERVVFDYASNTARYESLLNKSKKDIPLQDGVQDLISTFYWFRRQPAVEGKELSVDIYTDEKIFKTEIRVAAAQPLELLGRGTFSAITVEPKASFKGMLVKRGRIWAYLTADHRRLPLMVKATTPWGPMNAVIDEKSFEKARALWENADRCAAGP